MNPLQFKTGMNRNFGLDLMRATAVAMVVLCHFAKVTNVLGSLGVDLFFSLSGFLIGGIFLREFYSSPLGKFAPNLLYKFLRRRWYRTLPNFYLFLVIYCIAQLVIEKNVPRNLWQYATLTQNFAWRMPGFFLISWSLAIEEWFYLIFPCLAVLLHKLTNSRRYALALSLVFLIFVPISARIIRSSYSADWIGEMSMVVIYRLDALMYGVAMAWINYCQPAFFLKLRVLAIPSIGVIALMLAFTPGISVPYKGPFSPALVLTVVPVACALLLPAATKINSPKGLTALFVTNISLWSYSIYLSHQIILNLTYHVTQALVQSGFGKMLVKLFCLGAVLVVSKVLYSNYEVPIMNLRDRRPPTSSPVEDVDRLPQAG